MPKCPTHYDCSPNNHTNHGRLYSQGRQDQDTAWTALDGSGHSKQQQQLTMVQKQWLLVPDERELCGGYGVGAEAGDASSGALCRQHLRGATDCDVRVLNMRGQQFQEI